MRGKWLLMVRRLHLYLSVFFAPLLLLFIVTGWAQTMGFARSTPVMHSLSEVHTAQYYPLPTAETGKFRFEGKRGGLKRAEMNAPTKWLVVAMCVALLVSVSLGLVLAFTMVRNRIPVWIALILGVATPVTLLVIAHLK